MNLPRFPGMVAHRSAGEIDTFVSVMKAAGLEPAYVGACIEFETGGTWSPQSHGPSAYPGEEPPYAVGLIGFAPATARALGTTTLHLEALNFENQLNYVVKYFQAVGVQRLKRPVDYYAAVFWPRAVGTDQAYVIAEKGSSVYEKNSGLDYTGKGAITTSDLAHVMNSKLGLASGSSGRAPMHVVSGRSQAAAPVVGVVAVTLVLAIFAATVWGVRVPA